MIRAYRAITRPWARDIVGAINGAIIMAPIMAEAVLDNSPRVAMKPNITKRGIEDRRIMSFISDSGIA
jgi:hypothetical protein